MWSRLIFILLISGLGIAPRMPDQMLTKPLSQVPYSHTNFSTQIQQTDFANSSQRPEISTGDLLPGPLLPDLQTLPLTSLRLYHDADSGRTHIRFNNSIWNSGPGKLELIGNLNQARDQILVVQRIYGSDSDKFEQYEVGEFVFHDQHDHWHLEQFASYEVWSVDESGILETMVATGGKVSYCVMDVSLAENNLSEGIVPRYRSYTHCEGNRQGLSVGWIDTYKYFYPGQSVDVSSLEDGIYALVSTVDPLHLLIEENTHNNSAMVYFAIQDSRLKIVDYLFIEENGEPNPR